MKSKITPLYMLTFSYAVFSFAVYSPYKNMSIYDWLKVFLIGTAIGVVAIVVAFHKKTISNWVQYVLMVYLIFLLSSKIYAVWRYTKMYHSRGTADAIMIVTAIFILIFVAYPYIEVKRFAIPLFIFSLMLIAFAILFNSSKINRYNLYMHIKNTVFKHEYRVTMFDYTVPFMLLGNKTKSSNQKNMILIFVLINFILVLVTLVTFSCFRGDFMYSISPLQIAFQLSSTNSIRNFDGLFSFLLIFAYFATILLILWSLSQLNLKIKYRFLFLVPVIVAFMPNISEVYFFIRQILIILFMRIGVVHIEKR